MYWLQLLWAIVRGVAAGISAAKWDDFLAEKYGFRRKPSPEQPPPDPFSGPATPSGPAAGVRVEVDRQEGEFAAGVPYMGGAADPRLRPTQAAPSREGESRRKRRSQPAAPTPTEQLCARCKSALEHELTAGMPADLAVAQEAADLPAAAAVAQPKAARPEATSADVQQPAPSTTELADPTTKDQLRSVAEWVRPPLLDRLVTRLSTRGALTRLVEPAGAVPSGA